MNLDGKIGLAGILHRALANLTPAIEGATANPRDELFTRCARGTGRFSADGKFISLDMKCFTLAGQVDGDIHGVWENGFKSPQDLLSFRPMPKGSMGIPVGHDPNTVPVAHTKAIWSFTDGSSITVVGPATSHFVALKDGSFILMVSTAQAVTGGTGRYKEAVGFIQSLGATHLPAGIDFFAGGVSTFAVATIDTFKLARRRYRRRDISGAGNPTSTSSAGEASPSADRSTSVSQADDLGEASTAQVASHQPKQLEINRRRMSYIDAGAGDNILILCFSTSVFALWHTIVPHMSHVGRCIVADFSELKQSDDSPGSYTYCAWDYIDEFIDKVGLNKITLVVNAWPSSLGLRSFQQKSLQSTAVAFMEPFGAAGMPNPDEQGDKAAWAANETKLIRECLELSQGPKLILYSVPGIVLRPEDLDWFRHNLTRLETVNLEPSNKQTRLDIVQEKYARKIGETIANWHEALSLKPTHKGKGLTYGHK